MNTAQPVSALPLTPRLHPLLATAAIAVTTVSLAGLAALSGLLPMSRAAAPAAAPMQPGAMATAVPPAQTIAAPAPKPKPKIIEKIVQVEQPAPAARAAAPLQPVAQTLPPPPAPPVSAAAPLCTNCGSIESIRELTQAGAGSGLGAVLGGVAGGLLGSQVGGGNGKTLTAVLGAAGGAYAGHQIEKSRNETKHYEISVRMADGTLRSVTEDSLPAWRIGDRVRLDNGRLSRSDDSGAMPLFAGSGERI